MLETLTKRINQDENATVEREAVVECSQIGTLHSDIEKVSFIKDCVNDNTDELKQKLASVELSKDIPMEANMERLVQAAKSPLTESTLVESVVSTSKTLTITKADYEDLKKCIKTIKNESANDAEKKDSVKKIKSFLKACVKGISKCHDDKPADAFIISIVNSLCTIYDCKVDCHEEVTKKAMLILKLNALSKSIK